MSKKKLLKMRKIQDFMDKRNLFFGPLPISPWASFATWLHQEAPPPYIEKINKYRFSNIELVLTHMVSELGVFSIARKLLMPSITLLKKIQKKFKIYYSGAAQNPIDPNWVDRNFKG